MATASPTPDTGRHSGTLQDRHVSEFLLTRELAELLRTPESTIRYWRHIRTGPPSFKVGRRVLYRREAVTAWLQAQERAPEESASPQQSAHPGVEGAGQAGRAWRWVS